MRFRKKYTPVPGTELGSFTIWRGGPQIAQGTFRGPPEARGLGPKNQKTLYFLQGPRERMTPNGSADSRARSSERPVFRFWPTARAFRR